MNQKVVLVIMDGWGIARDPRVSAVDAANTPFYDESLRTRSHMRLYASEQQVGLPAGQFGNSEVGHMNIGAGRVVYQDLVRIGLAITSGEFANNPVYRELVDYCRENHAPLHLMGLLSDGGVHSHIDHLKGILEILSREPLLPPVYIHVFLDGRDTDPNSGLGFVEDLEALLAKTKIGRIASVVGRYYAMDRNKIWERTKKAYDLIRSGQGQHFTSASEAVRASYAAGITDEFMEPAVIVQDGEPIAPLHKGDGVLFFNFRTDRGRQLTEALSQRDFIEHAMRTEKFHFCILTRYDHTYKDVHVLFEKDNVEMGLGETLAHHGKQQLRIAETEKYPHVTFFFNGGREDPFSGESRILCPSPKVATYDLKPEMSAFEIRDKILPELEKGEVDFVCLNFANPDMVGHTGIFDAAVKACETVDVCTRAVVETATAHGYYVLVTADHGNADCMLNPDGSPHTAHTTALVPLILHPPKGAAHVPSFRERDGKLGDLAPTILHIMGLPIPKEMTGEILVTA
jgi:2,3-bisphosphoglycerate-independent phosphoglycerate mutase